MPPRANLTRMNALPPKPMTLAEFLQWEEAQPLKHEFDGRRPVAMTGGTYTHARIQRNLAISVGGRLAGKRCEFFGSDARIEVAGRIRYPDGFVLCSAPPGDTTVARDPVVIFEILRPGTAGTDLFAKNEEFAATTSVRRYVILAQDAIRGTVFERIGDDRGGHILGVDAVLRMPEIGIEVPLAEFYRGVDLSAPAEDTSAPA
jgi:Uma2 family endonuclease